MTKKELATVLHAKGYNCAQCVACTFADELNMNIEELFKLTEALGFGMGNGEGVCGALSGTVVALGKMSSTGNIECPDSKAATYKSAADISNRFKQKVGSIICCEIKGAKTGTPLLSCDDCIGIGIDLLEEYLTANKK